MLPVLVESKTYREKDLIKIRVWSFFAVNKPPGAVFVFFLTTSGIFSIIVTRWGTFSRENCPDRIALETNENKLY